MKEITRIHIAKTPYNIELAAKKALEAYMQALEAYSQDTDIIEDVELRITEILEARGVQKGGVITAADVKALKEQLGDPSEFMGEGDMAVGPETTGDGSRKLFRDTEHAVFGGVLSGIAAFFKINPVWVRLLFVILALASFGTMLLVYVVLWIAVPPARTAADKLQMNGQPVTVRAIREMNENDLGGGSVEARADARQALFILLGVGCVFGALGAAGITVAALVGGVVFRHNAFLSAGGDFLLAAFVLALLSGLLLTVLFTLGAYASFARKLTRRIIVSICVVVAMGLATFGTAAGLAQYGSMRDLQVIRENTREEEVVLPKAMASVKKVGIKGDKVRVEYVVTKDAPTAKLRATVQRTADLPKINMEVENGALTVTAKQSVAGCGLGWGCDLPLLTIYGPALDSLVAEEGSVVEYSTTQQQKFTVVTGEGAQADVTADAVGTLNVTAGHDSSVGIDRAAVQHLKATLKTSASVEAGTVQSLDVTYGEACPARAGEAVLNAEAVTEGTMTINGKKLAARAFNTHCLSVDIANTEDNE